MQIAGHYRMFVQIETGPVPSMLAQALDSLCILVARRLA